MLEEPAIALVAEKERSFVPWIVAAITLIALAADGQKFLVTRVLSGPTTRPLNVIVNWRQLLR